MFKKLKILFIATLALVLALGLSGCGSADKTKKLLSEIDLESGYHLSTETNIGDNTVSVDMYQRGDDFKVDAKTSKGNYIFLYMNGELTLLDPESKTASAIEMNDEIKSQISVFSSNGELLKYLAQDDREYTKSTTKLDGMEYETEETEIAEGYILKLLYNDEGSLAYMISTKDGAESVIKVIALDGDVTDEDFKIPGDYKASQSQGSSSDLVEVVNSAGGYSFVTSKANTVNKVDERTMVYTTSNGDIPYFNVFIMDKGSTQNADSLLDAGIKQAQDKYQNRLPAQPVKKTQNFNGYSAKGIEYSYSTEDGKDLIIVQRYYIGLGDKWVSFFGEFNSGDNVSQAEMFEAMATVKLK